MINFDQYAKLVDRSTTCEACLARDPANPPSSWLYREFLDRSAVMSIQRSGRLICHVIGLCNFHLNDQDKLLKAGWEWITEEDLQLFRVALLMKS